MILALLGIWLLSFVYGCEEATKAPDKTEADPEIHLGQGWSSAEWYLIDDSCPGENYCLNYLFIVDSLEGSAEIAVTAEGILGSIEQSAEMTETDFTAFFELVQRTVWEAIRNRDGEYNGCDTTSGRSEAIGFFAGDAGWVVYIGGCDDQNVTEIREQVRLLTSKYFPGDEDG
jgi:hypothetical protein